MVHNLVGHVVATNLALLVSTSGPALQKKVKARVVIPGPLVPSGLRAAPGTALSLALGCSTRNKCTQRRRQDSNLRGWNTPARSQRAALGRWATPPFGTLA